MPASSARKARRSRERRMRSMGVEVVERVFIGNEADVDHIAWETGHVVKLLALSGADLSAKIAITIGEHPSYPGSITIEGKASKKKAPDLCDCPIDHSESELDES